jgi:hypothetical protein
VALKKLKSQKELCTNVRDRVGPRPWQLEKNGGTFADMEKNGGATKHLSAKHI